MNNLHEHSFGRLDAKVHEAILVGHGQDHGLDELLNLLVKTSNVAVLLRWPRVHLHGLHSAVVLAGEGVEDQVGVLGGE